MKRNLIIPYQATHETQQTDDSNEIEEEPSSSYVLHISEIQNESGALHEADVIYETAAWAYGP